MLLFGVEPQSEPSREGVLWSPQPTPSVPSLIGRAGSGLASTLLRLGRWLRRALGDPGRARRRAGNSIAGIWEVSWNLARPAPEVPLNAPIGPRRRFHWATFDLAEFK